MEKLTKNRKTVNLQDLSFEFVSKAGIKWHLNVRISVRSTYEITTFLDVFLIHRL
jgi:hypothetical protein